MGRFDGGEASLKAKETLRFRADIQGLRAVAVVLVVLYHAGVPGVTGGYVGVDVFFVISGFLITSLLVGELDRHGSISFGAFYVKRALRILPASLVVLVLSLVAALLWLPPLRHVAVLVDAAATTIFVPNLLFANRRTDYLSDPTPSVFQHYWSLGVEEQFYLLWPVAIVVIFKLARRRRYVSLVLVVLTTLSFVGGIALTAWSQPLAFFLLPSRAWEFGAGALVALAAPAAARLGLRVRGSLGWLGLGAIFCSAAFLSESSAFPGAVALIPVMGAAVVLAVPRGRSRWSPGWLLEHPVMQFFGAISYSLYLVHWPLLVIPQTVAGFENELSPMNRGLLAVAAVPLAYVLYRFVEMPFRQRRARALVVRRKTLGAAILAPSLVAGLVVAGALVRDRVPLDSGQIAPRYVVKESPTGTGYVSSNLRPALRTSRADNPQIYANGCHKPVLSTDARGCKEGGGDGVPKVVLFGDSHAANWEPSLSNLAVRDQIALTTNTKSGCPSVAVPEVGGPSCGVWRDKVIAQLNDHPPDVIVVASATIYVEDDPDAAAVWAASLSRTLDRLPRQARIVMIAGIPIFALDPALCLSAHLNDAQQCAISREDGLNASIREAEVSFANESNLELVDMAAYLCNARTCPAIVGDVLVYRDRQHLTKTISESLAPALAQKLGL